MSVTQIAICINASNSEFYYHRVPTADNLHSFFIFDIQSSMSSIV